MKYYIVTGFEYKKGPYKNRYNLANKKQVIGHIHAFDIKYLIEQRINIHEYNFMLFKEAVIKNHFRITKLLLQKKADINNNQDEALKTAIALGRYKMIKFLLKHGSNPNNLNSEQIWQIKDILPFNTKYKLNLTKEEITQSTINQYLSWAEKI